MDSPLERAGFEPSVPGVSGFDFAPEVRGHTSMMDRLMDRKIVSQNRLDKGVALVAILILLLCLSPMFWELASAVRQFL